MTAKQGEERLPVKLGIGESKTRMTRAQALKWGEKHMDPALKRAGFTCYVSRSDPTLHGGDWFRINYGK